MYLIHGELNVDLKQPNKWQKRDNFSFWALTKPLKNPKLILKEPKTVKIHVST